MKFIKSRMLVRLFVILAQLMVGFALTTNVFADNAAVANISAPRIPVDFILQSDTLANFSVQNPLYIFFKAPSDASSTRRSVSYNNFAKLVLRIGRTTADQLSAATSGINIDNEKYIVLDMTALPAFASGRLEILPAAKRTAIAWVKTLTVSQAAALDNEFIVIAFDKKGRSTNSSFAQATEWTYAYSLKILFKATIYNE